MIIDKELELSSEQAVTASAASTNVAQISGVGATEDLAIVVTVKEAVTAAGAATVQFQVAIDDAEGFGTEVIALETAAIGKADLPLKKQIIIPLPKGTLKKYLRLKYVVATGPLTAGKFDAQIVEGFQYNPAEVLKGNK